MRSWQTALGTSPPAWMRYAVGVGSVVVALLISLVLYPYIEPNPFALFVTAVTISSWYGGLRSGLLATLLSLVTIDYLFIAPLFTFSTAISDVIRLTIFLIVALLISSLSEARRISETRYAVTLASLGDAVITTDTAGRVVFMNAVAEALTGWTLIEARGNMINDIVQLVHMDTRQKVENPVDQVLRDGRVVELANHTILIARDGTERALDDSGAPIRNEAGRLLGVVLVFRDVTARVQAEVERERLLQETQAAQQNLVDVLDRITDAFCAFDRDWRVTYINPQATKLTRKTPQELLGNTIWNIFPDVIESKTYQEYHRAMAEQAPIAYENYYAPYDQWTETRVYPSPNGMTIFSRDVTIEKRAQAAAARNAERKNRLQSVTALLSQALTPQEVATAILTEGLAAIGADAGTVVLLTPDGTDLEVIQAIGYPANLIQQAQRIPLTIPSPQGDTIRSKAPIFIESRDVALHHWPDLASAHEQIDLHAWANLPLLVGERAIGALGFGFRQSRTFSDDERAFKMTLAQQCALALERAQLYITEQQARAEAEAAVRMREQFLSIAAHELRTPLTSLLGNAQLMQRRAARDGILAEREQRVINIMVDQARRLDNMIVALLDISRLETGQLAIKREQIDIGRLVQRIIDEIQPTLDLRPLELINSDSPLLIDGDALRLEQVFQNLIQNAIKYSDPIAPITIRITENDMMVDIRVEDQGIGIDPAELPYLFQRFYRSDAATVQQMAGLGIGLFVVQEIVKLHGGSVSVESTQGVGSTFIVCLPRLQNS